MHQGKVLSIQDLHAIMVRLPVGSHHGNNVLSCKCDLTSDDM